MKYYAIFLYPGVHLQDPGLIQVLPALGKRNLLVPGINSNSNSKETYSIHLKNLLVCHCLPIILFIQVSSTLVTLIER